MDRPIFSYSVIASVNQNGEGVVLFYTAISNAQNDQMRVKTLGQVSANQTTNFDQQELFKSLLPMMRNSQC